jgi:hypothetical protein
MLNSEVIMKKILLLSSLLFLVASASATNNANHNANTNANHNANHNANTNVAVNQNHVNNSTSVQSSNANQNSVNTTNYVNTAADAQGGNANAQGGNVGNLSSSSGPSTSSTQVGNVSSSSGPSTSSAQGGAVGNVSSGSVSSSTGGSSTSAASADGAGANSNNVTMVQNYESYRIPVNTAFAASLTSGQDTCVGSASGGVQTQVVGISIGKTYRDRNCELIKQVQLLNQMGMPDAACFRARAGKEGEEIDAALAAAGIDCRSLRPQAVVAQAPVVAPAADMSKYVTHEELLERDARMFRRQIK